MTLGLALQGFALENTGADQTKAANIAEITAIIVSYTSVHLTLLENDTDQLIIKEYINQEEPANLGTIVLEGSVLFITGSSHFSLPETAPRLELSIPRSYRGNCNFSLSSGTITAEGELTLANLGIELSDGSVTLGLVSAENIRIKSAKGTIKIEYITGKMRMETINGSILIRAARGEGTFQTSLGRIMVGLESVTGDLLFETGIGAIALSLPREFSFFVDALTGSGNIRLDSPDKQYRVEKSGPMKTSIGPDPLYTVRSRTGVGNITMDMTAPL
ncbi:MAG: DUF4097 domain-containing protein [Spirochaetaceae bacterium]|nr:DUF4097 domain-containing protein [Spirochaetaceae bacterium]